MDIYEPENEFYGLIGRPKITAVQPYSASSNNSTKDIVIHFNDDDYGTQQDEQQPPPSNEQQDDCTTERKVFKQEPGTNDENYMRGNFVELNFGHGENGSKKGVIHQSAVQLEQGNLPASFFQNNQNVQLGHLVYNATTNLAGHNPYKQYQILQERGGATQQQQQQQQPNNIPVVKFENQLISQQQTSFNATTGAYQNRVNNNYQPTAIDSSQNSQLMDSNASNTSNDNSNGGFQQRFEQELMRTQSSPFSHVANGIYQTSTNQEFQGHHRGVVVKTEKDENSQSEMVINNVENTKADHSEELKGSDGDKPLEPEMDIEGKGSVVCPICGVTYSKYYFNLKHRFFHSGKKYDCSICGRSFNHQHNMYRHKRVHEDINDYQFHCEEDNCEMVFKTQTGLKRHMQMKHSISATGTGNNDVHYAPSNFKQVNPTKKRRRRRKGSDLESVPLSVTTPSNAVISNIHTPNAITNNFQQPQALFTSGSAGPQTSLPSQLIHTNQAQMSANPGQISGNPPQMSGNPQPMSGNPPQMSGNPQQMSGNPQQMSGNPPQMSGNPPQMSGNPIQMSDNHVQQIGGNPNQMNVGNPNQIGGNPNQMTTPQLPGNQATPQLATMIDNNGKVVQQQFYNGNQMEPSYSIGQSPALSLPQTSYNNNNNNKNYNDLKCVSTSQPMPVPATSVHRTVADNFNQVATYQDSSMIQLVPRVPVLQQNPSGYVNMDQPYQNQGYINSDKQNVERMSPYTDYQMPPQPAETNLNQQRENKTSLEEKKNFSANNGNKNTAVTCHICDKDFSVHYIREHLDHHAGRRYTCYICGMVFLSRDRLKRHKNQHTNKNDYDPYCVRCKLYFPSEKKLAFHIRKVHDGEQMKSSRILQREGAKMKKAMLDQDSNTTSLSHDIHNSKEIISGMVTVDLERKIQVGKKIYFKCKYCNGCFKSKRNRNKHELMHEELAVHSNNLGQTIPNPIMPEFNSEELEQQKLFQEGHLNNVVMVKQEDMNYNNIHHGSDPESITLKHGQHLNDINHSDMDYIHHGSVGPGNVKLEGSGVSASLKQENMDFNKDDFRSNGMEQQESVNSDNVEYQAATMDQQRQNEVGSLGHEFQSHVLPHGNMNSTVNVEATNHNIQSSNNANSDNVVIPNNELPSNSTVASSESYHNGYITGTTSSTKKPSDNILQTDQNVVINNENDVNNMSSSSGKVLPEVPTANNNNTVKKIPDIVSKDTGENNITETPPSPDGSENAGNVQKDMHKCPYCDSVFKKDSVLKKHISLHLKKTNQ